MHKQCKKIIPMILSLALSCSVAAPLTAQAAAKPKLSATKLELEVDSSKKLSVKTPKRRSPGLLPNLRSRPLIPKELSKESLPERQ